MTSQTVDVCQEISNISDLQVPTKDTKTEVIYRVASSCSCPQCNSFDCFKRRYEKGNLLCTCPDCKVIFTRKNNSSKRSGFAGYGEVTREVQDNGQYYALDTQISKSINEISEKCNLDITKEVLKECDFSNMKRADKIYLGLNRNEDALKDALKAKTKHDLESCHILTSKVNDQQIEALNVQSKSEFSIVKFRDHNYSKITEEKNLENIKTQLDNVDKESNSEIKHYDKTIKVCKDDEQRDARRICVKCKSNKIYTKPCCEIIKNSRMAEKDQDTHDKSNITNIKSDKSCCEKSNNLSKRCEQKGLSNTCTSSNIPHEKRDQEMSYQEITKKIYKEYAEKDTLNKHSENKKSAVGFHTEFNYKDATIIKDQVGKREHSYEESYTRNYSVAMTYSQKEEKLGFEDPTATLSAQIMNMPYQDYKDSLSLHKPTIPENTNKITKQDILARLKEIYKACSCKICECIPGFSTNDVFKSDTCGCENIKHSYTKITQCASHKKQEDFKQLPHSGCACYSCDRKDCRGVWKNAIEKAICDCEPCECVKFSKSYRKSCNCEPCQCAECTALNFHIPRPVVVAPVQGNFQQNMCQCEPCECEHCTHNYGAMASSLLREASTGMTPHRNCNCDTCVNNSCQFEGIDCRCDTQSKIMRKPNDRSVREYDLRQALVKENNYSLKRSVKINNCDTIAMYAFSNCSNTAFNKSRDGCHCIDCECIICKNSEKYGNGVKYSYEGIPIASTNLSDKSFRTCKCLPCECQICCKDEKAESGTMQAARDVNNCECDICDCSTCKGLPYCSQVKENYNHSKTSCKNNAFNYTTETSKDLSSNIKTKFCYPIRSGKLLTPSMFEAKIQKQFQSQPRLSYIKKPLSMKCILKVNSNKDKKLIFPQDTKNCHLKSFDRTNIQSSNSNNLVSTSLNGFDNHNILHNFNDYIENSAIICDNNVKKCIKNIKAPSTNIVLPKETSTKSIDNTIMETINHKQSNKGTNDDKDKLLNRTKIVNFEQKPKNNKSSDVDLFYSRILSFEKSILQIQEDILRSRKALTEICSKSGMFAQNTEVSFYDVISVKSLSNIYETNIIGPADIVEIYKEPNGTQNLENNKFKETVNKKIGADVLRNTDFDTKYYQSDNFNRGDNKMYTNRIKKSHANVNKIRRNVVRSRVKKLQKSSKNKMIDFISDHVKETYRHHGTYNLNHKYNTKSASTSHDILFGANHQNLNMKEENEYSQTEIDQGDANSWYFPRKNILYINPTPVKHKSICTIPGIEATKRMQSKSLQTNETQGHAALTKLQSEVTKLLNSPLLELKSYLKSNLNVVDQKNDFRHESKLDLELKHNVCSDATSQTHKQILLVDKETNYDIGPSMAETNIEIMKKMVDFLLTRTVCKSELTKPLSSKPDERPEVPKVDSVNSTCEGLKARFLGLRRVSDHTVLVRWRMPRQVEDVQGYELQVDGRPVQKILSPTRCMAVLTCLPHCEKLVLTIRTLTRSAVPPDRHPAATVVYWPREKHPRYPRLNCAEETL